MAVYRGRILAWHQPRRLTKKKLKTSRAFDLPIPQSTINLVQYLARIWNQKYARLINTYIVPLMFRTAIIPRKPALLARCSSIVSFHRTSIRKAHFPADNNGEETDSGGRMVRRRTYKDYEFDVDPPPIRNKRKPELPTSAADIPPLPEFENPMVNMESTSLVSAIISAPQKDISG